MKEGEITEPLTSEGPLFRRKSRWIPPKGRDQHLESFISAVRRDMQNYQPPKYIKDNLTKDERSALKTLRKDTVLIIKPEDKGPAFVIQDRSEYVKSALKELSNEFVYKTIDTDITFFIVDKIKNLAEKMVSEGDIDIKTAEFLIPENPKPSRFYTLPKTHKKLNPTGKIPIRPVIAGSGSAIENLSAFVDYYINPGMQQLPSYIRDTKHILNLIQDINNNGPLEEDISMFTIDVKAMYPSMPRDLGIRGVRNALNNRSSQVPSTENLIACLEICLDYNNFVFGEQNYIQIHGTSIGPKMAPGYACLGMGVFEEIMDSTVVNKPIKWTRYIDDIWGLWKGDECSFNHFMASINSLFPGELEFTSEFSNENLPFLDLSMSLKEGYIHTSLYTKPLCSDPMYVEYSSYHNKSILQNIAYSQALRFKSICSKEEDKKVCFQDLERNLKSRGYPPVKIKEFIQKADKRTRENILTTTKGKDKENNIKAPLVVTRNPRLPPCRQIIDKHFHILQLSETMRKEFPSPPRVIYRQPPNLRSLLVQAKLKSNENPVEYRGCYKTHTRNCVTCNVLKETNNFKSTTTGQVFRILGSITCTTISVIYLLNCLDCNKQYVGETGGELRQRHRGHRQEFRKGNTPLGTHFNSGCNNFELIGISHCPNTAKAVRERKELAWIYRLSTFQPTGLNVKKLVKRN